jgi:O-antigen ligase
MLKLAYFSIFITCIVVIFLTYIYSRGFVYPNGAQKIDSSLGANPVSLFAATLLPVGLYVYLISKNVTSKLFYLFTTLVIFWFSIMAESKAAWIIFILQSILFYIFFPKNRKAITFLYFFILLIVVSNDELKFFLRNELINSDSNNADRLVLLRAGMSLASHNSLIGVGVGNLNFEIHNAYVGRIAEQGVLGLIFFAMLILYGISRLKISAHLDRVLLIQLVSVSFLGFFSTIISTHFLLYFLIGIIISSNQGYRERI